MTTGIVECLLFLAFPQAALADEDHVLFPPHEVARGQLLEGFARDRLGVEGPVEGLERCRIAELGFANPPRDGPFLSRTGRFGQHAFQDLQSRELRTLPFGQELIESLFTQRNPQCLEVFQNPALNPVVVAGLLACHRAHAHRIRGADIHCWDGRSNRWGVA